jgi:hypothetical protein
LLLDCFILAARVNFPRQTIVLRGATMGASTAPLSNFVAVGPTRTASTWLHQVPAGHVGLPRGVKEAQLFIWNYHLGLKLRADPQPYLDGLTGFLGIASIDRAGSPVTSDTVNRAERMPYNHRSTRRARKIRDALIRHRLHRLIRLGEPIFQAFFNGGAPYPPLDRALEHQLRWHLAPEVTKLERLLKRGLSCWRS